MAMLTLALLGQDRTGLVRALATRVAAAEGNWMEARMARLAGQFAGIVLIDVADADAGPLADGLRSLGSDDLRIHITVAGSQGPAATRRPALTLSLVGQDRPGIVRDIADAIAAEGVNIEELTTDVATAAFSGESLFRASARLSLPEDAALGRLRSALEALAAELMVDVDLVEAADARA